MAFTPGLILLGLIDNQRRFLNMIGKSHVPMICQCAGTFLHIFLCYYFVWIKELRITGVGIAGSISNGLTFFFLLLYTYCLEELREAN
jgi:Na+-driven multidrug efflux pump